ncbi:Fic family protein [Carboxylicivirga sp. A043]|uniref:Fic family protein n=1 Tax=Carboxylicivirga litoralis TaxID=2816963 RepID=UPI0021CB5E3C|nr:Fic family protein [Carboxylicivirga sp. A043]MCU4155845.1 Fic family protein [Carboxylicivirga sp. A043]
MKPPYSITGKILKLVATISEKIGEVNSAHLNKPPTELRKKNRIKTIHSSLEIEGNTLTLEQITAIVENKRVVGPKKDILEVKNAIEVYEYIDKLDPYSFDSFCEAHGILMNGLIDSAGKLRNKSVGIVKGEEVAHVAPSSEMLKPLMLDLFDYVKNDDDLVLIKSCVFHYEMEFIHPFIDGNGRMGRLWQTLILKDAYPVFEYLPIESLIKEQQEQYYESLGKSDNSGESTVFIEFMLNIILESLEDLLNIQNVSLTNTDRLNLFKSIIKNDYFTRKEYLKNFREISSATASRDLKFAVDNKIIEKIGDKNTTRYRYK